MRQRKYDFDVKEVAKKLGIKPVTLYNRIKQYGYSVEDACSLKRYAYKPKKVESVKVESCDGLQKSLSNLYGTIDKILQAKIAMRKLAKLPELAEHFTGLSQAEKEHIDDACGGIKVNILNNPKEKEFIYNVVGTDGQTLRTNDKAEFMAFMAEVA